MYVRGRPAAAADPNGRSPRDSPPKVTAVARAPLLRFPGLVRRRRSSAREISLSVVGTSTSAAASAPLTATPTSSSSSASAATSKEAMESVSGAECREGKAVMSNKEDDKECQVTKEEKGQKKGKKHKDKGQVGDCEGKAVVSNKEEKDCQITKEEKGRKKGKKHKDKGRGGDCDSSIHSGDRNHSIEMEEVEVSAKMTENPCLDHAEGVMSKSSVKEHRKKKKKDKEVETIGQNQVLAADENVGSEDVERNNGEKEHDSKSKKRKRKHQDGDTALNGSGNNENVGSEDAERNNGENEHDSKSKKCKRKHQDDETALNGSGNNENVGSEDAERNNGEKEHDSKSKKHKRKHQDDETALNGSGNNENVGSENAERNNGEKEHDSKSKKHKRKHQNDETALNGSGNKIVLGEDSRRKMECLVTLDLEEDNKSDMSKIGKKTENKKKRRKERNNTGVDLRQNAPAGEGKNGKGNKEKKVCEDENDGGEREKENVTKQKDKGRRVSFTDEVEVFNIGGSDDVEGDGSGETELVHGRRFTSEEDTELMEAMVKYAEMKQLGEKGLEMIGESKKHAEIKGCWAEIAKSLPHRPAQAVYKRARILLQRSADRKWTQEEYEIVRRFVEKNGKNWRVLAKQLGKNEVHVKDTWRRIKPKNLKKGTWTQDEYQNLFDLVNLDLRVKAHQNFDHGHRRIRDNISWEAISDKLTTRSTHNCCLKWYQQLASPLVKEGSWADTDDYLLVEALQNVDAVCVEDVDWENLLEHRSGELCRRRWNQMVRLIGGHRDKPFIEQVEVLAGRYCPEMLEYRKPESGELPADELAGGSDL